MLGIRKRRIDDKSDPKLRIISRHNGFFERFLKIFLDLGKDKIIRDSDHDFFFGFINIYDPNLPEKSQNFFMIKLIGNRQNRPFSEIKEIVFFLVIVFRNRIKKHFVFLERRR